MKRYSKLLGEVQKSKTRLKLVLTLIILSVRVRYGGINSAPKTSYIEQVHNSEEDSKQVMDTDGKVQKDLSLNHLIQTGLGNTIVIRPLVSPHGALNSTAESFEIKSPIKRSGKSLNTQAFTTKTSDSPDPDSSDSESEDLYLNQVLSENCDNVETSSDRPINEIALDFEISDSEEIYDEECQESNDSTEKHMYLNSMGSWV